MGAIKRLTRRLLAHGIDYMHRRRGVLQREPDPQLWNLAAQAPGHLALQGHDLVAIAANSARPCTSSTASDCDAILLASNVRSPRDIPRSQSATPTRPTLSRVHCACCTSAAHAEVISHFELWLALRARSQARADHP